MEQGILTSFVMADQWIFPPKVDAYSLLSDARVDNADTWMHLGVELLMRVFEALGPWPWYD